ncbi:GatB/YqeY domain-containing protein [Lachnospiraceae bacterium 48-42]|nr:GatB/YqeY domain-containing protein [Dorea sp.]
MSKIEEVRSAMVAAMKAGDKPTKESLSMLLSALKNKAIDKRADLTEEEEIQVVLKEIKQTKETLEMTPADRADIIDECTRRIAVLEQYAPKLMDEEEIRHMINATLSELGIDSPTAKDKGRIMKVLMPKVKGKADGKLVNQMITSLGTGHF